MLRFACRRGQASRQVGRTGGGVEGSDQVDHEVVECLRGLARRLVVLPDQQSSEGMVPAAQKPHDSLMQGLEQEHGAVALDVPAVGHNALPQRQPDGS